MVRMDNYYGRGLPFTCADEDHKELHSVKSGMDTRLLTWIQFLSHKLSSNLTRTGLYRPAQIRGLFFLAILFFVNVIIDISYHLSELDWKISWWPTLNMIFSHMSLWLFCKCHFDGVLCFLFVVVRIALEMLFYLLYISKMPNPLVFED